MSDIRMGEAESRFAEIIWNNEPLPSGQLAKLAEGELNWKKTTSFTVLKRLCDRGIFQNEGGTVTSKLSREEYYARHSQQYVAETFGGSLPAFYGSPNNLDIAFLRYYNRNTFKPVRIFGKGI